MSASLVQGPNLGAATNLVNLGGGASFTLTAHAATAAGHLLVLQFTWNSLVAEDVLFCGGTASNVDSAGNTWIRAAATAHATPINTSTSIWYVLSGAGGTPTIKVTFAGSINGGEMAFSEWTGGTFTFDQAKTVAGSNTTSYTPAAANELGLCSTGSEFSVTSVTGYSTFPSYPEVMYQNTNCGTGLQTITLVNDDGCCNCCIPQNTSATFALFKVAASTPTNNALFFNTD